MGKRIPGSSRHSFHTFLIVTRSRCEMPLPMTRKAKHGIRETQDAVAMVTCLKTVPIELKEHATQGYRRNNDRRALAFCGSVCSHADHCLPCRQTANKHLANPLHRSINTMPIHFIHRSISTMPIHFSGQSAVLAFWGARCDVYNVEWIPRSDAPSSLCFSLTLKRCPDRELTRFV